jgi:GNAT superfamily N-acetyltransferase
MADARAIGDLIPLSVRSLQDAFYTREQREAALGTIFAVDRQLIRDGTYFVVETGGKIIGCGGWSRRRTLFGGDQGRDSEDPQIDPATEPARVRSFFVDPAWAQRGVATSIMMMCESAMVAAGFRTAIIVSTLAGMPLYAAFGYRVTGASAVPLDGGISFPVVTMARDFSRPV